MNVDTDVLIWYLRGHDKAKRTLDKIGHFSISDVVQMELLQGIRNKDELRMLKRFFSSREISFNPITPEISSRSIYFLERFALSHGLKMADALIAATADIHGERLLTGNIAHYKMVPNLDLKKFSA